MKDVLVLILVFLLFIGCGRGISGTGQHGEAIVAGTIQNSQGQPAAFDSIVIARSTYSTSVAARLSYDDYTLDTIETNGSGSFHVTVPTNGTYTISSRNDSSLLFYDDIYVSDDGIHLGTLQYEKGDTVKIYPWWDKDNMVDTFFVEGTDWYLTAEDTLITTFILPDDSITLVHFIDGEDEEYNINADDTLYLGDTTGWEDSSNFDDSTNWNDDTVKLVFDFPKSVGVNEEVTFFLKPLEFMGVYTVTWYHNEAEDTIYEDSFSMKFDVPGEFVFAINLLQEIGDSNEWELTGITEVDTIVVIDTFEGGDSLKQK